MKRISSIWIAILGIVVGALIVLAYNAYNQKRNMLRVQYGDWRKLNLILDQDRSDLPSLAVGVPGPDLGHLKVSLVEFLHYLFLW